MERYLNLGGDSGVSAYEIEAESITVRFSTGATYIYTYQSAGASNIEEMKALAKIGRGLNSFINTRVKYRYASRLS